MRVMPEFPELELVTLVTGGHLMENMGGSLALIEQDGFPVSAKVPLAPSGKGSGAWSRAMGTAMTGFADAFEALSPDIILLSGDRAETLTLCVTAAYMGIFIAHIQAGDKSGHIDDAARYAIAKLAHIHLASCEDSVKRLRCLGEQEFRIHNVGAPQLDDMGRSFSAKSLEINALAHDLEHPYLLLVQHSVMVERDEVGQQMRDSLEACLASGLHVMWVYPNSDLGFDSIIGVIDQYRDDDRVTLIPNLERDDYLTLLYNAAALVGNSSSGILEAPSFHTPVINIGNRQRGRPQASNILNCPSERGAITDTIRSALKDADVRERCARAINPYGDGKSSRRICDILRTVSLDRALLDKETVY